MVCFHYRSQERQEREHASSARPATEKQLAFVRRLVSDLYEESAGPEYLAAHEEEGTFADSKATSALIDALLARKKAEGAMYIPPAGDDIPKPGYYAVEYKGTLNFYCVRRARASGKVGPS